jgi:hypothetical protein
MKLRLLVVCSALLFVMGARTSHAATLYSQPLAWAGSGTSVGAAWSIEFAPPQNVGFQVFDEFELTTDAVITGVTWFAMTLDAVNTSNNPVGLNGVQNYRIAFHEYAGATPGAQLHSETEAVADVATTLLGTGIFQGSTVNLYRFAYELASPFALTAGTYWFTPQALTDAYNPELIGWVRGLNGNSSSVQAELGFGSDVVVRTTDRAFSVRGAAVPEPATFTLLGGALAAFAASRWRARRRQ